MKKIKLSEYIDKRVKKILSERKLNELDWDDFYGEVGGALSDLIEDRAYDISTHLISNLGYYTVIDSSNTEGMENAEVVAEQILDKFLKDKK